MKVHDTRTRSLGVIGLVAVSALCACDGDVAPEPSGASAGAGGSGGTSVTSSSTDQGGATATGTTTGTGGAAGAGGGSSGCDDDVDCAYGVEWCVGGECVACDNSGTSCFIDCASAGPGWSLYARYGCTPCDCAPPNECLTDAGCDAIGEGVPVTCYPGSMCWDWCPPGDPSCCFGNQCSIAGCEPPNPTGCMTTGCPLGQECAGSSCTSSSCECDGGGWNCTDDCGGGTCIPGG